MDRQRDRSLRLTQGEVDVDDYPEEPRRAMVRDGVFVGNKDAAEDVVGIMRAAPAEERPTLALLSCNGNLPSWWRDHDARCMPAIALGFDDLEVNHPRAKMKMLNLGAGFIHAMLDVDMPVLIYCYRGASRSVVMAAYHLVLTEQLSPAQALEEVMEKVEWAAPSLGMVELLVRVSRQWMANRGG